jgi:hypothetical protein
LTYRYATTTSRLAQAQANRVSKGPTPKNDFCRIFSRSKILYPLALVLHRVLDEERDDEVTELIEGRIVNIFYLFSQAENYVKEVVADRQVLKSKPGSVPPSPGRI